MLSDELPLKQSVAGTAATRQPSSKDQQENSCIKV